MIEPIKTVGNGHYIMSEIVDKLNEVIAEVNKQEEILVARTATAIEIKKDQSSVGDETPGIADYLVPPSPEQELIESVKNDPVSAGIRKMAAGVTDANVLIVYKAELKAKIEAMKLKKSEYVWSKGDHYNQALDDVLKLLSE